MKRINIIFFPVFIFFIFQTELISAQQTFYNIENIQKIEINFLQANWDFQLDTAKNGDDGYIMANWIKVNGVQYDSVGVKYKGNSSYDSTRIKNPFHISLDEFKSQSYEGITDIKLGNHDSDPSMIREPLAYMILQNFMDCPRANYAQLYINGYYIGLYSNIESINKQFCSNHFYSSDNTLIKCNPVINPGPTTKSNLKYIASSDSSAYFNFYEIKSDYGWNDLVDLCNVVTNLTSSINNSLDMDRILWMLAFDNVLVNLDSYIGVFAQNYYLYKDNNDRFNPIIWDLNMAFGGFPYIGSSLTGMGSLTISDLKALSTSVHATDPYWPLINIILNNNSYKHKYFAHVKTITNDFFTNSEYITLSNDLQNLIDTAVQSDSNKFFSYEQFQNSLTSDYSIGSYFVPGISNLMNARVGFLQSTAEFGYTQPNISMVTVSNNSPQINSSVTISALVTNSLADSVKLYIRNANSEIFSSVLMYDDGNHNDGIMGDNVYAAIINMTSNQLQYYIYAENSNIGKFSPENAEHEYYILQTAIQIPNQGEIKINEFLALNQTYNTDENGEFEDWIEFFNTTANTLSLSGLYLTDDYSNPTKFAFPEGTVILPHGLLTIWADEDESTTEYIHCNFKLSGNGEMIILSDGNGLIYDSLYFGTQTADVSIGRCPDGSGEFISFENPTFNMYNCIDDINEQNFTKEFNIFPNPSSDEITIQINDNNYYTFSIVDFTGKIISTGKLNGKVEINTLSWENGLYLLQSGSFSKKFVILH